MKNALISLFIICSSFCWGWYPHKTGSELRLIAKNSIQNLSELDSWEISGQLLKKKIGESSQVGAMFELGSIDKSSKVGGHYTYSINEFVDVALSLEFHQHKELGGSFWVNLNIPVKGYEFKPFFNINNKKIGEIGVIIYKKIRKTLFNVGISAGASNEKISESLVFTVILGTSFDNFDEFLKTS